jgi:hypothetical protein
MFGTTYTGLTHARGGFQSILLAANYTDEFLVQDLNAFPSDNFDLIRLNRRPSAMAAATAVRFDQEALYPRVRPLLEFEDAHPGGVQPLHSRFAPRRPADPPRPPPSRRGRGARGRGGLFA